MAKVTSKLQLTLPKVLAEKYGIRPGDDVTWKAAGDAIRIVPARQKRYGDVRSRLKFFDQATARHAVREKEKPLMPAGAAVERGWTREELYDRGGTG